MNSRDMELDGINGNIKIDEYNEMNGYSVAESTAEYLAQWAKDNTQDQAVLAGEPLACEYFKHGKYQAELNSGERKELQAFLSEQTKDEIFKEGTTNFKVICHEWNKNNPSTQVDLNTELPNYRNLQ